LIQTLVLFCAIDVLNAFNCLLTFLQARLTLVLNTFNKIDAGQYATFD